jgi:molecular chaperone DnaJ
VGRERKLPVKIPAGIADGQRLRLYGEGEHGFAGGPPGDLYVVVHVRAHQVFKRDGDDLYCELPVPFTTLALGGSVNVPTIDGTADVDIPEATSADSVFRIRGKGMPNVGGRGRGDLFVAVKVGVPKKLTRDQRRLLEELARTLQPEDAEPSGRAAGEPEKPFFERVKDIFG